jgi:hypothetical protein
MLTSLLWALAPYLVAILFPAAVSAAAFLYMSLLQRLPMQQRLIVLSMAHSVVRAIEQMVPDNRAGSQKKDQALAWLAMLLSHSGVTIPKEALEVAIEAAVFELHTLHPHTRTGSVSTGCIASDTVDDAPFPWRPTLRALPAVQTTVPLPIVAPTSPPPSDTTTPTAPTAPIIAITQSGKAGDANTSSTQGKP